MSDSGDRPDLDPTELARTESASGSLLDGERIGPYRLLGKLGEGGMGEVWLAEQTEPVRRKVALKVIKQGMDTKQVVARFEAERQALAMMDHPSIAKVYDAGATPRGRPYFVMEHVQGVPITEYCDRHKLTNGERLELFLQVCDGVQHAHHKAVIHRDLKPSNVMVAIRDDKPVPKIIDFGVAKATAQKLTAKTMHTQLGVLIGTPAYMSPEQAEMTNQDVDTRTDVYALGVMLYELLVGALPFDMNEFGEAGIEAMVRKIREDEPPRPSSRLTTLGDQSTESANRRRTELPALKRELSGDLDWITLKTLEKDRTRRYSSPHDLATDIERYLADQPVLASPPSAAYRGRKFVRRHKGGVITAAAGLLVLLGFAVTMTVQNGRISRALEQARLEAEARAGVSEFVKDMFRVSNPGTVRGNSITAREILDMGAARIDEWLVEQPEIRAELMLTLGQVYSNLGLYAEAEPLCLEALETQKRLLGADHPSTLHSMLNLASLYDAQGRYAEAETLHLSTLESNKRVLGADHPSTLASMNNLGGVYKRQGRYAEAESFYASALEGQERLRSLNALIPMGNLAEVYVLRGRPGKAETLLTRAVAELRRVFPHEHPVKGATIRKYGLCLTALGRYEEAEANLLEAHEILTASLGADHQQTQRTIPNLVGLYETWGKPDKAVEWRQRLPNTDEEATGEATGSE